MHSIGGGLLGTPDWSWRPIVASKTAKRSTTSMTTTHGTRPGKRRLGRDADDGAVNWLINSKRAALLRRRFGNACAFCAFPGFRNDVAIASPGVSQSWRK